MKKGKVVPSSISLIVRDSKGRFSKHDGRLKQTIYITDKKTGDRKVLTDRINKKLFTELKEKKERVFKYDYQTFKGYKLEIKKPVIEKYKKIRLKTSLPYELPYEKGYERINAEQDVQTIQDFKNVIYTGFNEARKTDSKYMTLSLYLDVKFRKGTQGRFFIGARKYKSDISQDTIQSEVQKIKEKARARIELFTGTSAYKKIRFITKISFVYKKESKKKEKEK